jgi:hypothetical protein
VQLPSLPQRAFRNSFIVAQKALEQQAVSKMDYASETALLRTLI